MQRKEIKISANIPRDTYLQVQQALLDLEIEEDKKVSVSQLIREFFEDWLKEQKTRKQATTKAQPST